MVRRKKNPITHLLPYKNPRKSETFLRIHIYYMKLCGPDDVVL